MSAPSPRLEAALADRYKIERPLGQGGMAMVYLARDLRHDRLVALKVLRPELAAVIGAARFLAEIKTTANLQHPHILPLHDSGEADGTVFYVMPFVEGQTLRARIQHEKQLPVDESVKIAKEVAGALDYAHRHGVVHRDIKPENILLHDGQALVADFGISLAVSRSEGGSRMTETGMSLGTPHYMAPEQAMGEREITAKADIYALGCVLYEMLTGEPPFTGTTAQQIIARAVTESPRPITMHRHTVPVHVEATTLKALEKLPADRFASAAEFAAALENPALTASAVAARPGAAGRGGDWRARAAIPLAAIAMVSTIGFAVTLLRPAPPAPVSRYALSFATAQAPVADRPIAISPDGSHLAYIGPGEVGGTQIWLKSRDSDEAEPLAGTSTAVSFTFSPDGRWIAFTQQNQQVKKVPILGGAAIALADFAQATRGIAWLDDGTIVYLESGARVLKRIPDVGGPATVIWEADSTQPTTAYYPVAIAGGRGVLFTVCEGGAGCPAAMDVWAANLRSLKAQRVAPGAIRAFYAPTGHLVYVRRDGGMLAVPFSARSLRATGAPFPVKDSIAIGVLSIPAFALSNEGTLLTRVGGSSAIFVTRELVWVDRAGRETAVDPTFTFVTTSFGANVGWAISPDGNRVAIGLNTEAGDNVWVKQLPRGPLSRLTFDSTESFRPRWTRDGRSVIYTTRRGNNAVLMRRAADGTGKEEIVFRVAGIGIYEGAWAPDGKSLALRAGGTVAVAGGRDIMIARPGIDSVPTPLVASTQFDESGIAISPDGRWLAYESNETGRTEVYLRPFPNADGGKWQVSAEGGRAPLWNRNGRELFYVNGAREMVVVPVGPGVSPQIGTRRTLFKMRDELYLADQENYTPFDISPDGQRFLMARRVQGAAVQVSPLVVTENWFEELKRIVARR